MNNKLFNPKNAQPNCFVPQFNKYGFMCSLTNAVFVFDEQFGYQPYMPLDEAVQHGEVVALDMGAVA